jgi:hypothetical protein
MKSVSGRVVKHKDSTGFAEADQEVDAGMTA